MEVMTCFWMEGVVGGIKSQATQVLQSATNQVEISNKVWFLSLLVCLSGVLLCIGVNLEVFHMNNNSSNLGKNAQMEDHKKR